MKKLCFYHSADLDGHCSGAIVRRKYPDIELIGINYGDEFPWDKIGGNLVMMVDFSLQPFGDMVKLFEMGDVVWIDHHKSAIEDYNNHKFAKKHVSVLNSDKAACELVWEFLYPEVRIPRSVYLLGRYDVWDHSDPDTMPFQWGMRMYNSFPDNNELWNDVLSDRLLDGIIGTGSILLEYRDSENEKYVRACGFDTELDGLRCIAINRMLTNSQMFDSIWDENKYDAMLTFGWRKGSWTVSLYSTKSDIDVSLTAKNRGGGGHKDAAGFQCPTLPFQLKGR